MISVVVPVFNEAGRIGKSINRINDYFISKKEEFEIIVCNDGSTDGSAREVFNQHLANVSLLNLKHKGKAHALLKGVKKAEGEYILLCDADLSTPIEDFDRLMEKLTSEKADIVIASREGLHAKRIGEPFYRHIMGRGFNFLVKAFTGLKFEDTQCGFKLFKGVVAKDLFSKMKNYTEDSPVLTKPAVTAYDVEILYLAQKHGYKISDVSVTWNYEGKSSVDPMRDSIRNFMDILRIKTLHKNEN